MKYVNLIVAVIIAGVFYLFGYTNSGVTIAELMDVINGKTSFSDVFTKKEKLFNRGMDVTFLNSDQTYFDTVNDPCSKAMQTYHKLGDYIESFLEADKPLDSQLKSLPISDRDRDYFNSIYTINLKYHKTRNNVKSPYYDVSFERSYENCRSQLTEVAAYYYRTFAGKPMHMFTDNQKNTVQIGNFIVSKGTVMAHYFKDNMLVDFRYVNKDEHRTKVGVL